MALHSFALSHFVVARSLDCIGPWISWTLCLPATWEWSKILYICPSLFVSQTSCSCQNAWATYHFSKDSSAFLCYQRLWTYPQTGWIFQRSKDSPIFWDLRWGYFWMICMDYGWYHLPSISQSILFEYGDLNTEKCFMTQDSQLEMCQSKNHLIKKAEVCHFDVFFVDCLRIKVGSTFHLAANGWEETSEPPGSKRKNLVRHPLLSLPSWAWRYRFLQLHRQEFERWSWPG